MTNLYIFLSSTFLVGLKHKGHSTCTDDPDTVLLLSVNPTHGYVVGVELALIIILLMLFISSSIVMVIEGFIEAKAKIKTTPIYVCSH